MRFHLFDQQLGRGPGHPPICDALVADELRRRGADVVIYRGHDPVEHSPPVGEAIPAFRGTMADHVGRDPLTWPLEDYVEIGETLFQDLVALGRERFAHDDIVYFANPSQNMLEGIRRWVQTLDEDKRPVLILKFSMLNWATPRFQDARNKNLIPLLYRLGMPGLLATHRRTVICTDTEEMAAAFRSATDLTLPVLPLPLSVDPVPAQDDGPLCITYLGYASPWKGFHLLPQIVTQFGSGPGRSVRFAIEAAGDAAVCAEVERALAANPSVSFIRGEMERSDYVRTMQ